MANRNMQQKKLKMARQRRAWFNNLRGRGLKVPNRDVIKEYKHHAQGLADVEFADRVASEIIPDFEKRKKLALQAQQEAALPSGCDNRVLGPTGKDNLQESWIYSNARRDCFVLIHVDLEQSIERTSQTYSTLELLMMCWEGGAIKWVQKRSTKPL